MGPDLVPANESPGLYKWELEGECRLWMGKCWVKSCHHILAGTYFLGHGNVEISPWCFIPTTCSNKPKDALLSLHPLKSRLWTSFTTENKSVSTSWMLWRIRNHPVPSLEEFAIYSAPQNMSDIIFSCLWGVLPKCQTLSWDLTCI